MAEIIPMTEEQKFQLEIYKLVMNQNAAAEEAFQFIGTLELLKQSLIEGAKEFST